MAKTTVRVYKDKIEIKNPNKTGDFNLLSSIKNFKINLIFGEDISYVFQATIPNKLKKIEENHYILDLVTKHIPEDLNNHIWGYKVLNQNKERKHIVIFSPVKEIYVQIQDILFQNNIKVSKFETSQIARLFGKNDIEGIQKEKKSTIKFENKKIKNLKNNNTNFFDFKFKIVWFMLTIFASALGAFGAFLVF